MFMRPLSVYRNRSLSKRHPRKTLARNAALAELMEPRILFTAAHSVADLDTTLLLAGMNKFGNLTANGSGVITAGSWINQSGPATLVGTGSSYAIIPNGATALTLNTNLSGNATITTTNLTGVINATDDVVALNETNAGNPVADGLDLLIQHAGVYTTSDLAGQWNLSALDFRGNITLNASGNVTVGLIYLENGQLSAPITAGTATLNPDGTGTLNFNTGLTGSFATVSLNLALNSRHDVAAGDATALGDGTTPAELTVLTKTTGPYAAADVVGTTWAMNSADGAGSITFKPGNALSGLLTDSSGALWAISGNYTIGGDGSITANLFLKNGTHSRRESLTGGINPSKNLIALDRAIANGESASHLTILTCAANHAPTVHPKAIIPASASQQPAVAIDYPTLLAATNARDLEHDPISFIITNVPAANGTLSITHDGLTTTVVANQTMGTGDTLTWVPSQTLKGQLNAFTVEATDGTADSNPSKVFIATAALPVVTIIAKKSIAEEALAGQTKGDGTFQLTRAGGDLTQPLTVTLGIGGSATDGTNYELLGPDNATLSLTSGTTTVTFPANASTITVTVAPIEDGTADGTLNVAANVLPDPSATASYLQSVKHAANVNIFDSHPTVFVTSVKSAVREGDSNQLAFFVERLPAQGGNINSSLTVNLDYTSSTFDVSHLVAPASVTFAPGEVKKRIVISTTDDGVVDVAPRIVATLVGTNFNPAPGEGSASVAVIDNAPTVRVKTTIPVALESDPTNHFGEFTVTRTGDTTNPLVVDLSNATTSAVQGVNYMLEDASNNVLTNTITIPAGASSAIVKVVPIDDGKNDGTLIASITAVADPGPGYHLVNNETASIRILNNDRFPTVANAAAHETTPSDTPLSLSFSTLVTDMGAALAAGSDGTLRLQIGKILAGRIQILRSGAANPIAASAAIVLNAGDTLIWTPPHGVTAATSVPAFTLFARDGTLASLTSTLFAVSLT